MADTSDPSTPRTPGSSAGPGTPRPADAAPVGDELVEDAGEQPGEDGEDVEGEPSTEDDDPDADRTKNTIGNIR